MTASKSLSIVAAAGLLLFTAGCGGGYAEYGEYYDDGYYPDPIVYAYGAVEVDNLTDTTTFEDVYGFYLSLAGLGDYTGNLLAGPLPPGFFTDVGEFIEDYYDGEADLEFGDLVTWFDVAVPAEDVTTFEVY